MFNYDKLESAIKNSGKTKKYLCSKLDRPSYYLRDVIKQKNSIPPEYQTILANELGVSVEWLNDEAEKPTISIDENVTSKVKQDAIREILSASDEDVKKIMEILHLMQQ